MKRPPDFLDAQGVVFLGLLRASAAALALWAWPASAASDRPAAPTLQGVTVAAPRPGHETGRRRLSKFEARKIRHACYARADERGLKSGEREAFVANCYVYRVAHRTERQRCRQEAAAKGIDKTALRDFLRECVKERARD